MYRFRKDLQEKYLIVTSAQIFVSGPNHLLGSFKKSETRSWINTIWKSIKLSLAVLAFVTGKMVCVG